jgi:hypothetical protein
VLTITSTPPTLGATCYHSEELPLSEAAWS